MICRRSTSLALGTLLALLVGAAHGEDAKTPRTDLYGDPLPPGVVMRLGMRPFPSVVGGEELAFSADGKRLLSASSDGQVRTWDAATGELLRHRRLAWKPQEGYDSLATIVLSPDGSRLAAWDRKRVYVYDTATGRELDRLKATDSLIAPLLRFSPDSETLLVQRKVQDWARAPAELHLWDVCASKKRLRLTKLSCPDPTNISDAAFTPDGRRVAGLEVNLRVWDTATGREVSKSEKDFRKAFFLRFSPDGKALTVLTVSPDHVDLLWSDLADNARRAYRAIGTLATVPARTIPFLKTHLHPVVVDAKRIEKRFADLNSDSFEARETATRELTRMRYRAEPILRRVLEGKPSLEIRRRIESILAEPKRPPTEALRTLRAIAALERIGTPEARRILEKLGGGAAAPETREAQAALIRLKRVTH